jgi:hypothetical protein
MRQTGDLFDASRAIELLKTGIAVGVQPTLEVFEMIFRPAALAIRGKPAKRCWRC